MMRKEIDRVSARRKISIFKSVLFKLQTRMLYVYKKVMLTEARLKKLNI